MGMTETFARVDGIYAEDRRILGAGEEELRSLIAAECHRHGRADGLRHYAGKAGRAEHYGRHRGQRRQGLELKLTCMTFRVGFDALADNPFLTRSEIRDRDDKEAIAD